MKVKIGGGVDCMISVFKEIKRHPRCLAVFFFGHTIWHAGS